MNDWIDEFMQNGFVAIRGAVAPDVVARCVKVIEGELHMRGVDLADASTWREPVVRFNCPEGPAFAEAGTSPGLWEVYDALLGPERWVKRQGVGGSIPARFPSTTDPGDAGWHIDGSFEVNGEYWVNVYSRVRGLLGLFLFTDVTEESAPTQILLGSHQDVPAVLAKYGDTGVVFGQVAEDLPASTFQRETALATGRAGDVFVCHPFLVHRATWPHRGTKPRMIAQPEIAHHEPFALRDEEMACPVERMIIRGLPDGWRA